jgi:hypothetical protein
MSGSHAGELALGASTSSFHGQRERMPHVLGGSGDVDARKVPAATNSLALSWISLAETRSPCAMPLAGVAYRR